MTKCNGCPTPNQCLEANLCWDAKAREVARTNQSNPLVTFRRNLCWHDWKNGSCVHCKTMFWEVQNNGK